MMYQGGKARVCKLIGCVLRELRQDRPYIEPFVGGAWVLAEMKGGIRMANDIQPDLKVLYEALQQGWEPPSSLTEKDYNRLKTETPSPLRSFAMFGCSWGGKPWGGYARSGSRNYALNARNSLLSKRLNLDGVTFLCEDYRSLRPNGCLVYCDPPYVGTTGYGNNFDHAAFWECIRGWSQNNTVVVSEYTAPPDFRVISEFPRNQDMRFIEGRRTVTERLFQWSGTGVTVPSRVEDGP